MKFRIDYDDDDGSSPFATLNPTTPSYSHLADSLSNTLNNSNSSNLFASTNVYSNHPAPSPSVPMDYQRKNNVKLCK